MLGGGARGLGRCRCRGKCGEGLGRLVEAKGVRVESRPNEVVYSFRGDAEVLVRKHGSRAGQKRNDHSLQIGMGGMER